jgi:hypothetical protein
MSTQSMLGVREALHEVLCAFIHAVEESQDTLCPVLSDQRCLAGPTGEWRLQEWRHLILLPEALSVLASLKGTDEFHRLLVSRGLLEAHPLRIAAGDSPTGFSPRAIGFARRRKRSRSGAFRR